MCANGVFYECAGVKVTLYKGDFKAINRLLNWVDGNVTNKLKSGAVTITIEEEGRNKDQNAKMWAMLTDFSRSSVKLSGKEWAAEHWKCFIMSAFNQEMPVMGLNGEPVNLGLGTSKLTKKRFAELVEFIYATGSNLGVTWSEPAMAVYEEYANR